MKRRRKIILTRKPLRAKASPDDGCRILTTWKAGHLFSPSKKLVEDLRAGEIGEERYKDLYYVFDFPYERDIKVWIQGLRDAGAEKITFLCYCADGEFCHTHLAIDRLLRDFGKYFIDGRKADG